MPIAVSMVCCESGAEDRLTGLCSFFNIIEKIEVRNPDAAYNPDAPRGAFRMRIVAMWMRSDGDADETEFEQCVYFVPPSGLERMLGSGTFNFDAGKEFFRFTALVEGNIPVEFGLVWFEARLRKKGEENWLGIQRYPVMIEEAARLNSDQD